MQVLIIGAGLGGLCLAHGLHKSRIQVKVFERQKEVNDSLAGYGIHIDKNGKHALRRCLPPTNWTRFEEASISAGTKLFFRDTELRVLAERDDAKLSGFPQEESKRWGIGRTELRDILLDGLMEEGESIVRWNKTFTHFSNLASGRVRAYFADGTFEDGDVLIGADGAKSSVRKQYLPHIDRLELGIYTIAGRCVLGEKQRRELPPDMINGSLNNIVPNGKGWMFVSSWKLPSSQNSKSDAESQEHIVWAYVIPQQQVPANIRSMSSTELQNVVLRAVTNWSPSLTSVVLNSDVPATTCIPLRSMPQLEGWTPTNVTVLGDAIHNMTPMAGVGANTALRDAELLCNLLTEAGSGKTSIQDAIGNYERTMRKYANEAVALSKRNAESASSGSGFQRGMFRFLLRAAQASPLIMRATIGKAIVKST